MSKRKNCGYGVRLYTINERPSEVVVEEFGRHRDDLAEADSGLSLVSPPHELNKRSVGFNLVALRSFARGLTPCVSWRDSYNDAVRRNQWTTTEYTSE